MALPEVNRARIEKLNIDVDGVKSDIKAILGEIDDIDPIILDENFPNIVPPAPSNVIASALFRNIQVSWAYNNASYIAEYEAHASQSPNFHTSNDTVVWRGMSGGFNHKASVGETWYFKIRIKNRHGEYSAFSEEISAITVDISDFEIDEQYKIDLIEYTNQYTDERKDEIMGVVAGKLDAQVYHDNIILKADSQTVEEQFDTIYDELLKKVDTSRVETIEGDLAEKADAVWVGNQLVSKADADTVYSKTEVDSALNSRVSTTEYETDQAGVVTRFESAESRVTQTENELSSKVDNTTYEALEGRVSTTETGVTQNATSIASKASQTDLDIVTGEVETLESTVTQQAGLIESKVDSTTYTQDKDGIISDINSHNTRITQNANDIELKASTSELASATGRLTTAEGKITANATAISQRVTQSTYDKDINDGANGLFARMENAEAGIDTVAGSLHLYATESSVDTRMGDVVHRFEANEADIAINSTAISNRVTHTEYNALTKRVSTAEGSVTTLAGQVALKASTSDLDGVKGRLSTAESTLTVLPTSIESKVSKDGVISAIRQTPESVKIQAAKVEIDGDLVVQNGLVRLKDAIIDKVHIKDSAIVGRMLADSVITNRMIAGNASIDFAKIGNVQITNAMISGRLDANKVTIGANTSFASGYNPADKVDGSYVQTAIGGIEVGGRNLARSSNTPITTTSYMMRRYDLSEKMVAGDTYTVSIKGTLPSGQTQWGVYLNGGSIQLTTMVRRSGSQLYTATFTGRNSGVTTGDFLNIYNMPNNTTSATIEWIKLEKGNKATDWSPAPEDNPALAWRYQNTTEIDGGNIRTNTIVANRIKSGSFSGRTFTGGSFRGGEFTQLGVNNNIELNDDGFFVRDKGTGKPRIAMLTDNSDGGGGFHAPALIHFEKETAANHFVVGTGATGIGDAALGFINPRPGYDRILAVVSERIDLDGNVDVTGSLNVRGQITSSGMTRFDVKGGYVAVASEDDYVYLQTPQEVRVTKFMSGTNYSPIRASAFRVNGGVDMSANTLKNDNLNLYIGGNGRGVSSIGGGTSSVRVGTTNFNNQGTNSGIMYFGRDGTGERIWSYSIQERTYSNAPNIHITGAGTLGRSTSASKYKLDINKVNTSELEHKLLSLDVKSWKDKGTVEGWAEYLTKKADDPELLEPDVGLLNSHYGLIAEDLVDAGLEMFVQYGSTKKDGSREVEGIEYDRLWVLLIPIVRALKLDNENLKRQVDALYGRMEVLENKESV